MFLKLIRWKNIAMISYTFILIKFVLLPSYNINSTFDLFQFFLFVLSICCIVAAGNVINDIFDLKADLINKPNQVIVSKKISIEKAKKIYFWLNSIGIVLGIYVSLSIEKPRYSLVFITASVLLFYYSKKIKYMPLLGNVLIAFLCGFSIYLLYLMDVKSVASSVSKTIISTIILLLSIASFLLNLMREIIKDIQDVNGDYKLKMNTLPIYLGVDRTSKIGMIVCLVSIAFFIVCITFLIPTYRIAASYFIVAIILPLVWVAIKLRKSKSTNDFKKISSILKLIIFLGINILLIFSI